MHLPILPSAPVTHRGRKLVIYTTSFFALRWAWRKFWAYQAKKLAKARAQAKLRRRWWGLGWLAPH